MLRLKRLKYKHPKFILRARVALCMLNYQMYCWREFLVEQSITSVLSDPVKMVFTATSIYYCYYCYYYYYYLSLSFSNQGEVWKNAFGFYYHGTLPCWSEKGRCQCLDGRHHAVFCQNLFERTSKLRWLSRGHLCRKYITNFCG